MKDEQAHSKSSSGRRAMITGVGHYLPDIVISSDDVECRVAERTGFRMPRGLIARMTGVKERHYRADEEQASDMAVQAARSAVSRAGITPADIDVLIFASCTQDITEPATANIIQDKLAAVGAHAFDVKNACNSFLNALDLADSLIRTEKAETILITVGETPSPSIKWDLASAEDLRRGVAGLTLGDAGGAAVVRSTSDGSGRGIRPGSFATIGSRWRLATVLAGGSRHGFDPTYGYFSGKPQALRDLAIENIPRAVRKVLASVGWTPEQVDVVCCHQVTVDLIATIAAKTCIDPDKCIISIADCGNTAAASIPIGMSRAYETGRLAPGTKVLLVGAAAGFSVGVIPVVW
jgi:3-oxoacyl-[acyl-carrier-protein] synthase-3